MVKEKKERVLEVAEDVNFLFSHKHNVDNAVKLITDGTVELRGRSPDQLELKEFIIDHWRQVRTEVAGDKPSKQVAQAVLQLAKEEGNVKALFKETCVQQEHHHTKMTPPSGWRCEENDGEEEDQGGLLFDPKNKGECGWSEQKIMAGVLNTDNTDPVHFACAIGGVAFLRPEAFAASFPYSPVEGKKAAILQTSWETALSRNANLNRKCIEHIKQFGCRMSLPTIDTVTGKEFLSECILVSVGKEKVTWSADALQVLAPSKLIEVSDTETGEAEIVRVLEVRKEKRDEKKKKKPHSGKTNQVSS